MKIDWPQSTGTIRCFRSMNTCVYTYIYSESISRLHFQELITRESEIELTNLTANTVYGVSVVARSTFGTSLPSTLLIINTTNEEGTK